MRLFAVLLAIVLSASTAFAHQLNVFAFVEGDTVVVESKFSSGRIPVSGDVQVSDAASEVIMTLQLQEDGTVRFPLDMDVAAGGLMIEVSTGEGHSDYWILTPDDIANGLGD